jgi:hypothetical protein
MPRLQSSLKDKSPGAPFFLSFFLMDRFINYLSFLFFKKINSDYMLSIIIFFLSTSDDQRSGVQIL